MICDRPRFLPGVKKHFWRSEWQIPKLTTTFVVWIPLITKDLWLCYVSHSPYTLHIKDALQRGNSADELTFDVADFWLSCRYYSFDSNLLLDRATLLPKTEHVWLLDSVETRQNSFDNVKATFDFVGYSTRQCCFDFASGVTGGGTAPGDTIRITFFWLNLERIPDKRHGKIKVVRRRQLKRSALSRGRWQSSVFFKKK